MEDSLGRKIDISNMNLDQIKSMISSMMTSNVKKNDFKTIPDKNSTSMAQLADLMKKLNSGFEKQLDEIKNYVSGMRTVIKEISELRKNGSDAAKDMSNSLKSLDSNSKLLNGLIAKGNKGLQSASSKSAKNLGVSISSMTPYLRAMTSSLQGMSNIFGKLIELWKPFVAKGLERGSIYVHDIYAQALLREMAQKMGVSDTKLSDIPNKLAQMIAKSGGSKNIEDLEKTIKKENSKSLKNLTGGTNKKGIMLGSKAIKEMMTISGSSEFTEALQAANLDDAKITQLIDTLATNEGISGKGLKDKLKTQNFSMKDIEAVNDAFKSIGGEGKAMSRQAFREASNALEGFTDNLFALEEKQSLYAATLGGLSEAAKYVVDYQKALYETTGLTFASVEAQKELFNIDNQILQTGVERKFAEAAILKNLRSGLRLSKESQKVVNAQLLTERQLGIESGSLTDNFRNLVQSTKMSTTEVQELGRGLAGVAKSANISGEAMKEVVSKTNELSRTLKSQGTFTAQSNTQIASIVAEASKLDALDPLSTFFQGIEDVAQRKQGDNFANIISLAAEQAGVQTKIFSRTLMSSADDTKKFTEKLKQQGKNYFANIGSLEEYNKLVYKANKGDHQAADLLQQVQAAATNAGIGIADFYRGVEAFEKGTKTASERLIQLDKDRQKGLLSEEEYTERATAIRTGASVSLLGSLSEAAKYSEGAMANVFSNFSADVQKNMSGAAEVALGAGKPVTAEATIQKALEDVNAGLKKNNLPLLKVGDNQIKEALENREKLTDLISTIQQGEARVRSEQQKKSNPLTEASAAMTALNETLRQMTSGLFFKLQQTLGPSGFLFIGLSSVFATALLKSKTFLTGPLGQVLTKGPLGKLFKSLPPKGFMEQFSAFAPKPPPGAGLSAFPKVSDGIRSLGKLLEDSTPKVLQFGNSIKNAVMHPISTYTRLSAEFSAAMSASSGGVGTALTRISGYFRKLPERVAGAEIFKPQFLEGLFDSVVSTGRGAISGYGRRLAKPLTTTFEDAAFIATKGGGKLLQAIAKPWDAKLLNAIPGVGQAIMVGLGAVIGGFEGFNNTARNFDGVLGNMSDKTLQVTAGMTLASTVGGSLAGILDMLTFGLFSLTGGLEPLEKIFTYLTYGIVNLFSGIFDGFMEGIKLAQPGIDWLFETFTDLYNTFVDIADGIAQAFGFETASAAIKPFFDMMYQIGAVLGKVIGAPLGIMFSGLGYIIGFLVKVFQYLLKLAKPVIVLIAKGLASIFSGLGKIFSGNILGGLMSIVGGIYEILLSPFTAFANWLFGWTGGLWDAVKNVFKNVFVWLFGEEKWNNFKKGVDMVMDAISEGWKSIVGKIREWTDWLGWTTPEVVEEQKAKTEELVTKAHEEHTKTYTPDVQQALLQPTTVSTEKLEDALEKDAKYREQEYNYKQSRANITSNEAIMDNLIYAAKKETKAEGYQTTSEMLFSSYGISDKNEVFKEKLEKMIDERAKAEADKLTAQNKVYKEKVLREAQAAKTAPPATAPAPAATPAPPATAPAPAATPAPKAAASAPTSPTQKAGEGIDLSSVRRMRTGKMYTEEGVPGTPKKFIDANAKPFLVDDAQNYYLWDQNTNKWLKKGQIPNTAQLPEYDVGSSMIQRAGLAFLHAGEMVVPPDVSSVFAESAGAFNSSLAKPLVAASGALSASTAPSENGPYKSSSVQAEFERSMQLSIVQHRANMELFKEINENADESNESLRSMLTKLEELVNQAKKSNEDFTDVDSPDFMGTTVNKMDSMCNYGLINGSAIRNG